MFEAEIELMEAHANGVAESNPCLKVLRQAVLQQTEQPDSGKGRVTARSKSHGHVMTQCCVDGAYASSGRVPYSIHVPVILLPTRKVLSFHDY